MTPSMNDSPPTTKTIRKTIKSAKTIYSITLLKVIFFFIIYKYRSKYYRIAITSISICAFFGNPLTAKAERAGNVPEN